MRLESISRSISGKLMLTVGLIVVIIAAVATGICYQFKERDAEQDLADRIAETDEVLEIVLRDPVFTYDNSQIDTILSSFIKQRHVYRMRVFDQRGKELGSKHQAGHAPAANALSSDSIKLKGEDGSALGRVEVAYRHDFIVPIVRSEVLKLMSAVLFVLFGVLLALAVTVRRLVIRPVAHINLALRDIAAGGGDLTKRLDVTSADELGELAVSFNSFVENLQSLIRTVMSSSSMLAYHSERISVVSSDIAGTARQQSEETTSMAAAMEQVTVCINHVADVAQETQSQSSSAAQLAEAGERKMQLVQQGMGMLASTVRDSTDRISTLDQRTQKIATIVSVIKNIADQTNLLALNAAIEAARAGEVGRGFAVVADDVRKLSERTSKATVEIGDMISGLQNDTGAVVSAMSDTLPQLETSRSTTQEAVGILIQLLEGSQQTLVRAKEVADAAKEQSQACTSIAQSVEQIANRVEQTSTSTTSLAGAATDVKASAHQLHTLVLQFRC